MIGVGVLFAYCYRPRDPLFSWMAALVVLASIVALGLFTGFQPDGANIWPTIVALAPAVGFVLIGVALALIDVPPPRTLRLLAIAVSAVLVTSVLSGLLTNRTLIAAISLPPMIVSLRRRLRASSPMARCSGTIPRRGCCSRRSC